MRAIATSQFRVYARSLRIMGLQKCAQVVSMILNPKPLNPKPSLGCFLGMMVLKVSSDLETWGSGLGYLEFRAKSSVLLYSHVTDWRRLGLAICTGNANLSQWLDDPDLFHVPGSKKSASKYLTHFGFVLGKLMPGADLFYRSKLTGSWSGAWLFTPTFAT